MTVPLSSQLRSAGVIFTETFNKLLCNSIITKLNWNRGVQFKSVQDIWIVLP